MRNFNSIEALYMQKFISIGALQMQMSPFSVFSIRVLLIDLILRLAMQCNLIYRKQNTHSITGFVTYSKN